MFNIDDNLSETLAPRHSCLGVYLPRYMKQMNKIVIVPVM
jgi:hypothetical protein